MPTKIHDKNRRPARIYLKEWIEFRGLTQEQIAGRMETSPPVISKLVSGKQRYNQEWLEKFAFALNCEVPQLYRPPDAPTAAELLALMTPEAREFALRTLRDLVEIGRKAS